MSSFLSLPPEIRVQIYRGLRSFNSPLIRSPFHDPSEAFGYCSFGFHSRILETSRQISYEAKEVFYGENNWTFFASQRIQFSSIPFQMEPMMLVLPYIRKAHIRFGMFHWLFWESCGLLDQGTRSIVKKSVSEICLVLLTAPALRTVKIIWTETYPTWKPIPRPMEVHRIQSLISEVVQPLAGLPTTSDLQRSNVMVAYSNGTKATEVELDFSECVDAVIALHCSRK